MHISQNVWKHSRIGLVVLLCLVMGLPALAQNGGISGRVTTIGGEPLMASVSIHRTTMSVSGQIWFTLTDSDGSYSFDNLIAGSYEVRTGVTTLNYVDETTNIEVFADTMTSNVDFVLDVGGAFTGTVRNASDEPLANVMVWAHDVDGDGIRAGITATDGTFQVVGLPSGAYYARATDDGANYLSEWYDNVSDGRGAFPTNATKIAVIAGTTTGSVDFVLAAGGTISGSVKNDEDVPLSNATVVVRNSNAQTFAYLTTDTNGEYEAVALRTGLYYVKATCDECNLVSMWFDGVPTMGGDWDIPTNAYAVSVTAGEATTNINFRLPQGATIEGVIRARADGSPLSGASVYASMGTPWSGVIIAVPFSSVHLTLASAVTDSSGKYILQGLATGRYRLRTSDSDQNYISQDVMLDVIQGTTRSNVNFKLDEGGVIMGRVTSAGGVPLDDVHINGYLNSAEAVVSRYFNTVVTDTNGEYRIPGLRAGTYSVFASSGENYIRQSKDIAVTAGSPAVLDYELMAGATISGKVTAQGGTPLAGITIPIVDSNGSWLASAQTVSNGEYSVTRLEAGRYFVQARAENTNYVSEWFDDMTDFATQPPSNAAEIVLSAGEVVSNVHFELAVGGIIAGRVTSDDAAPLDSVTMEAYDTNGIYAGSAVTATDGAYAVMGLPDGIYYAKARANNALNVLGEWYDNVADQGSWPTNVTAVPVSMGLISSNIDFSLTTGGGEVIAGRITDTSGNGIPWVWLSIHSASDQPPFISLYIMVATTDSDGRYVIRGWPTGCYDVATSAGRLGYMDATTAVCVTALSTAKVDFVLQRLPAEMTTLDAPPSSVLGMHWNAAYGLEYQVEQSSDLVTWSNAVDGDVVDEQSRRLGGADGFLEYHSPTGLVDRLFLRVKQL